MEIFRLQYHSHKKYRVKSFKVFEPISKLYVVRLNIIVSSNNPKIFSGGPLTG